MFRILRDRILGKKSQRIATTVEDFQLSKSLEDNIDMFKKIFNNDGTIIFREFESKDSSLKCCLIFVDGMVNRDIINENIIEPIFKIEPKEFNTSKRSIDILKNKIVVSSGVKIEKDVYNLISICLYGDTILLVDGMKEALLVESKGWTTRPISEPSSERIVRGPREGFNEAIITNLTLIRRKIRSSQLKFEFRELGTRTRTKICICYVEGIANKKILEELKRRLNDIEIDGILESGYVEELIEDSPLSPFATVGNTERPDIVAANLLEGRIALVVDGTPHVLTFPYLFLEYFQANEDYYNRFIYASINRIIRIVGFFLSTSVPAVYVALTTFHQEMIPTPLLLSISAAREGVPFPTIVEALLMLFAFEVLRESGVRLPKPAGGTISFVGALILGQSAVNARIVSAPIVIVTALTGISNFLVPKMIGALIIIRLIFLLLSAFLGLYGYIFGVIGLFIHLMSIRSFGIPYMLNIGSLQKQDIKDTAIRAPWWVMYLRPKLIGDNDKVRQTNDGFHEKR
ncbi:spore germination protein [Maledivibacter halophilus]|uniref:Spore germination protein KA n=1 Tax=Maledivibacter halophilus TaxID=36842 RepID=A0A1T5MB77_9FIRM|nr:spore germination protein [Maledivibacter halophilus]SKC85470.1 spore germination protein KA [Maledivibacter halophilus]